MEFNSHKYNETYKYLYFQVPFELYFNPLYADTLDLASKTLYALLLNRLTLSIKNNWYDEAGDVFLIFTRKEAGNLLRLSDKTVTKAFKQLIDAKLIKEKKQGANKPNYIYVGKMHSENNDNRWSSKKSVSRIGKTTTGDTEKVRPINNNNKYNNKVYASSKKNNVNDCYHNEHQNLDYLYANNYFKELEGENK